MWELLLQAASDCLLFVSETRVCLHMLILPNMIDSQIVRGAEGNFYILEQDSGTVHYECIWYMVAHLIPLFFL